MKICVIIRVYNRISDLEVCLDCIRKYWKNNDYFVIVVANGTSDGYQISSENKSLADKVIELPKNTGHLSGNSQLLLAGIEYIPNDCEYTVILEADTWIFSDKFIVKYIEKLKKAEAVWASAEWLEKYYSVAVDFAIVRSKYLKTNPSIFNFTKHAESSVCNYLLRDKQKYIYLKEAMPVHFPKLLRRFYNPSKGRMRCFTRIPMVTHHIEDLVGGLDQKKMLANITANKKIFEVELPNNTGLTNFKIKLLELLIKISPRSGWIKKKRVRSNK